MGWLGEWVGVGAGEEAGQPASGFGLGPWELLSVSMQAAPDARLVHAARRPAAQQSTAEHSRAQDGAASWHPWEAPRPIMRASISPCGANQEVGPCRCRRHCSRGAPALHVLHPGQVKDVGGARGAQSAPPLSDSRVCAAGVAVAASGLALRWGWGQPISTSRAKSHKTTP